MSGASVVVIGAGVVGASVAYHLAARGWRDVRVLERSASAGAGSTGRATGGFRSFFATSVNARLSLLSLEKLRAFPEEIGADPGVRLAGYLWLAGDEHQMEALRSVRTLQVREGRTDDVELDSSGVARLQPAVDLTGIAGGFYCPNAGYLEPMRILEGYVRAAERHGVRFDFEAEVVGLRRGAGGRIEGVLTHREEIAADFVVNAAGAWASRLAALAGVELPVTPLRRQVAVTAPFDDLREDMPMTIYLADGFHLRVRGGRTLLLMPGPGDPEDAFGTSVDREWVSRVIELGRRRVPVLKRAVIDERACYAGLYEMSPDQHALLGAAPGCENFYLANGSSGHGVMHAPALGHLLAEIISDGDARTVDVTALRPSRFLEGKPNPTDSLL